MNRRNFIRNGLLTGAGVTMVKRALADVVIKGNATISGNATLAYNFGIDRQHFTLASNASVFPGPYAQNFGVCDETFASGLGGLAVQSAGTGTVTAGGGSLTYSAAAQTLGLFVESGVHFVSPQCVAGITVTAASNAMVGIGFGFNSTNRFNIEYNSVAGTLAITADTAGVFALPLSPFSFTPSGTFSIALEVLNNIVNIWADTGSGWSVINGVNVGSGAAYDFRNATLLAAYNPLYYVYGSAAGAFSATISEFKGSYFNGPGMVREAAIATHWDGSPYITGGKYLLFLDHATLPQGGGSAFYPSTNAVVHPYTPSTGVIEQATINLCGTFGGAPATAMEVKIIYDDASDSFYLYSSNWGVITDIVNVRIYYAIVPRASFTGIVNVTWNPLTVVTDGNDSFYGVDVIKIGAFYYMVGTESQAGPLRIRVVRGSTPINFDTNIVTENLYNGEGVNFFRLGTKIYIVYGSYTIVNGVVGVTQMFDFSDLATLVNLGYLDVANPNTSVLIPQQPALIWFNNNDGTGRVQYLGFQDNFYQGTYPAAGNLIIAQSTAVLPSTQF